MCTGSIFLVQAQAQSSKQLVQADEYFAAGDYFTAANLYKQFLNPATKSNTTGFPLNSKRNSGGNSFNYENKTEILFKQAESYRLANYASEAAALYRQCFEKDSAKYAAALYWLAVCQSNTGNYQAASESIEKFLREFAG
jgi:tetratricopeptide (TPR) repeat protein